MKKAAPPNRRSHAERRSEARERLLNACIDLLVERGYARLTVADVAAKARLSLGAQTNYYRTKLDLVTAAAEYSQALSVQVADRLANVARKSREPVSAFIRHVRTFYLNRPYLAIIELLVAARTDPDLAERVLPTVVSARQHVNKVWLEIFIEGGLSERKAREMLHMTLFFMRGNALATMMAIDREEIRRCIDAWQKLLAGVMEAERGPKKKSGKTAP